MLLGAPKAHLFTKWVREVLQLSHAEGRWVAFFFLQRLWACIFHHLALAMAVSVPVLEDYINRNPSCPGRCGSLGRACHSGCLLALCLAGAAVQHEAGLGGVSRPQRP